MSLIVTWVLYALLGIGWFSAFFLWAVRARQFTDQERARYLPLTTLEEED
jgi:cbb3-type cytochrome oxidase maturation protein